MVNTYEVHDEAAFIEDIKRNPVDLPTPEEIGKKAAELVSFQQIMTVSKLPTKRLYIPLWQGYVVIQATTREQQHRIRGEATSVDADGNSKTDSAMVEVGLFYESVIQPRFTKAQVEELFHSQPAGLLEDIMKEVGLLNKADEKALEEARASFR